MKRKTIITAIVTLVVGIAIGLAIGFSIASNKPEGTGKPSSAGNPYYPTKFGTREAFGSYSWFVSDDGVTTAEIQPDGITMLRVETDSGNSSWIGLRINDSKTLSDRRPYYLRAIRLERGSSSDRTEYRQCYDIVDTDINPTELFCIWIEDGIGAVENVAGDDLDLFIEAGDDCENNQVYRIRIGEDEAVHSVVKKVTQDPDCLFYEIDFMDFDGKFAIAPKQESDPFAPSHPF